MTKQMLGSTLLGSLAAFLLFATSSHAQENDFPILFTNVHVFDGVNEERIENANVLVVGNLIAEVSAEPLVAANAQIIDGGGRTLMPGIIEGHNHPGVTLNWDSYGGAEDPFYLGVRQARAAKTFLDNGWTTVRGAGGPSYGMKKAIDEGTIPGPRIYPAGAFISQTSGHGDFRRYADPHPATQAELPMLNQYVAHIADGVPEVLRATREELRKGAVHIKVMAGGGLSSVYDPLHTTQYSVDEIKAAVLAAEDWGTYVMVHAYTDEAVNRAIDAGVKVIEHGQLISEDTVKRMAKTDTWLSIQLGYVSPPAGEQIQSMFGPETYEKWVAVRDGTETAIRAAKKYGVKVVFGTDIWGEGLPQMTMEFGARQSYFSNIEILRQATSGNAELLNLTGPLNPYTDGPLGVIEAGAYADILLIDGNPIENLLLLADNANIPFIMKNGVVYKSQL